MTEPEMPVVPPDEYVAADQGCVRVTITSEHATVSVPFVFDELPRHIEVFAGAVPPGALTADNVMAMLGLFLEESIEKPDGTAPLLAGQAALWLACGRTDTDMQMRGSLSFLVRTHGRGVLHLTQTSAGGWEMMAGLETGTAIQPAVRFKRDPPAAPKPPAARRRKLFRR